MGSLHGYSDLYGEHVEAPRWVSETVKSSLKQYLVPRDLEMPSEGHLFLSPSAAAAAAKSLQSCPTLCNPIDGSAPGSPVPGILQARTLEWVAISFSNA